MRVAAALVSLWALAAAALGDAERFDEELLVRRVRTGRGAQAQDAVMAHWQFTLRWRQADAFRWRAYNLFPAALGPTLDRFDVRELRLAFAKGDWDDRAWGEQPEPAPPGVELWARLGAQQQGTGQEAAWTRFTRQLAGVTCASLEQLRSPARPQRTLRNGTLYGQLSSEPFCTENLTPWLKLLPCRAQAGLAALLRPTRIFSAKFHSLALHFRRVCLDDVSKDSDNADDDAWAGCSSPTAELVLSLTAVEPNVARDTLPTLLDAEASAEACPIAAGSRVFVETAAAADGIALGDCAGAPHVREIDLRAAAAPVPATEFAADAAIEPQPQGLAVRRFATGSGRVEGGFVTHATLRPDAPGPVRVALMETVPAYFRVRPSSLRLEVDGKAVPAKALWANASISLGDIGGAPSVLELTVDELRPGSTVALSYEFKQAFLPLWEFPPDPNRGFDAPAVMLRARALSRCPGTAQSSPLLSRAVARRAEWRQTSVYSESLIVSMPLPDFSMPYNVITLSSTVMAFVLGAVMQLVMRAPRIEKDKLDDKAKARAKLAGRLKNGAFLVVLGLAWLFENDRDKFDELVAAVWEPLEAALGAALGEAAPASK